MEAFSGELSVFADMLSDEFLRQTGFGLYAYISPLEIEKAYEEFQKKQVPIHDFTRTYVTSHLP